MYTVLYLLLVLMQLLSSVSSNTPSFLQDTTLPKDIGVYNHSLRVYVNKSFHQPELPADTWNCTKEEFKRVFLSNKEGYLDEKQLTKLLSNCTSKMKLACDKAQMKMFLYQYQRKTVKSIYLKYVWNKMNIAKNKDCWGYLVQVKAADKILHFGYFWDNIEEPTSFSHFVKAEPLTKYEGKIISIPTMKSSTVEQRGLTECEIDLLTNIHFKFEEVHQKSNCNRTDEMKQKIHLSSRLCKLHPMSREERVKELSTLTLDGCKLKFDDEKQKHYEIFIVIIVTMSIFFICIALLVKMRNRKNISKCKDSFSRRFPLLRRQRKPASSVLILYPHGCEYLHQILRALAALISSYGIKVNLSLLESTKLDVQGGISKFYEEHIVNCDYTLVVCTEKPDSTLKHHKPFLFAMSLLRGQAFVNNDSESFIPLYITSFDKIKDFIPNFLLVHKYEKGFQIPSDILHLVKHLLVAEDVSLPQDVKNRNTTQINCMRRLAGQYLSSTHAKCHYNTCSKGELGKQGSFASSLFSSMKTVGDESIKFDHLMENIAMSRTVFLSRSHSLDTLCAR